MSSNDRKDTSSSDTTSTSYDHVLKYAGLLGSVRGLSMLASLLRNKVTAILLGSAGVGLIAIYNSIAQFVSSAGNLGIPFSGVRNLSEIFAQKDEAVIRHYVAVIRTWSVWTALLSVLICVGAAPLVSRWVFESDQYIGRICLLAPLVASLALTGGEMAILKATQRLKQIAAISGLGAFSTLFCTVPFYYLWQIDGIILALDLSTVAVLFIHFYFSLKLYPWEVNLRSRAYFRQGREMVRLGVPYTLAALAGSLSGLVVPSFLLAYGSLTDVGFYRVGYALMVSYAGMVFTSMEADYFPRLSAVHKNLEQMNDTVNKQIEIGVLLVSPILILLILVLPVVIWLLYSTEFLIISDMTVCATYYLFFKAITQPIAYIALAKGGLSVFLFFEIVYDVVSVLLIAGGYYWNGLVGTGIALSLSSLFDMAMIVTAYRCLYNFRFTPSAIRLVVGQSLCLALTVIVVLQPIVWIRLLVGGGMLLCSVGISYRILSRKTTIVQKWRQKIAWRCVARR